MPYEFTQDSFRQFQDDILKAEGDQATLTTVLADMQSTMTESMALVEATKQSNEKIEAENARLKEANMSLFLQLGEQAKAMNDTSGKPLTTDSSPFESVDDYMKSYFDKLK